MSLTRQAYSIIQLELTVVLISNGAVSLEQMETSKASAAFSVYVNSPKALRVAATYPVLEGESKSARILPIEAAQRVGDWRAASLLKPKLGLLGGNPRAIR